MNESDISESDSENESITSERDSEFYYDDLEELEEMYRLENAKRTEKADSDDIDSDDKSIWSYEEESDLVESDIENEQCDEKLRLADEEYEALKRQNATSRTEEGEELISSIFRPYIFYSPSTIAAHLFTSTTATPEKGAEDTSTRVSEIDDYMNEEATPQSLYEETDETANAEEVAAKKID